MAVAFKKIRKRVIKVTYVNPTEIVVLPENEVFLPTAYSETPLFTYTITQENCPVVYGATEFGYMLSAFFALAFRCQGTSSNVWVVARINGVDTGGSFYSSTGTKIQFDATIVVPCKIGDVISIFARNTVANNAALSYARMGIMPSQFGTFGGGGKNRPLVCSSIKLVDVVNVLEMMGSAKTSVMDNTYSGWRIVQPPTAVDAEKYVNTNGGFTLFASSTSEGKYLGNMVGGFPRNSPMYYCIGCSSSFSDYTTSSTSVDTSIYMMSLSGIAVMEVEYILP